MPRRLVVIAALCAAAAEHIYDIPPGEFMVEIAAERSRQDDEWGGPEHDRRHTAPQWTMLIVKHVGKLAAGMV